MHYARYTLFIILAGLATLAVSGCSTVPATTPTSPEAPQSPPKVPTPSTPAPTPAPGPITKPSAELLKGCPAPGEYQAFDMATYSDQKFLDTMRYLGMTTAIRYYDWVAETIKGKTPTLAEMALFKKNGFNFLGVFQHNSNQTATFTAARGKIDAARILELAKLWGQPKGSAVYLGVDGDFETHIPVPYFKVAAPILRAAGFRVGMYGSGANCKNLKALGLVDGNLCMIAASSWGWRGTKAILAEGKGYVIAQKVNQRCGGKSIDFDKLLVPDVGQWKIP